MTKPAQYFVSTKSGMISIGTRILRRCTEYDKYPPFCFWFKVHGLELCHWRRYINPRQVCNLFTQQSRAMAASQPGSFEQGKMVKDGWFTELSTMWPGTGLSLKIKEIVFQGKSDFQDVCVFESDSIFGRVLLLDGVIQCTEFDECSYQEMLVHLPLCSLKEPAQRVLVVGGGDGGVVREISRHSYIQQIDQAEIDKMVVEVSKKYFPQMSMGFDDPRLQLNICDGIEFVKKSPESTYDCIIVDSSDPVGPASVLFEREFYEAMYRALKPGGMIATQGESLWYHMDTITQVAGMCSEIFQEGTVSYAYCTIPSYPSGQIGFIICAKAEEDGKLDPRVPKREVPISQESQLPPVRYYSKEIHQSSFVLPKFAIQKLAQYFTFQKV
eukprot:TRINITY_DN1446_c0_g1_i2.p1 TRINITY_DN1446_c0_g1~~TRINITY_DN1446_c0_g1_i2.p1  ORF type:complete len:384 (+),score=19.88 TRINITY_DN1446_c0_g1_i2:700-1851(+)